jgi:hypothetical protein
MVKPLPRQPPSLLSRWPAYFLCLLKLELCIWCFSYVYMSSINIFDTQKLIRLIQLLYMLAAFTVFEGTEQGHIFASVWGTMMVEISVCQAKPTTIPFGANSLAAETVHISDNHHYSRLQVHVTERCYLLDCA